MIAWRHNGWIGVDLGSHAVKLAQLERVGARVQLCAAMIVRRSEPWRLETGLSSEPSSSCGEIRAALSLERLFSGVPAACTLPMRLCDVRMFMAPPADEKTRRAAIATELQALDLDAAGEREFDYWESDSPGRPVPGAGDRVHVVSLPRGWTVRAAKDVSRAGLRCQVLDGLPPALARAVEMARDDRTRPAAILDWGHGSATFCLVYRGAACFVRFLPQVGSARVAATVRDALGIGQDEANELLWQVGLPSSTRSEGASHEVQRLLGDLLRSPVQDLVEELNKTLSYLSLQHPDLRLERLLLCGGGATVRNVDEYLAKQIDLPVEVWRLSAAPSTGTGSAAIEPLLAPAIGLSALAWEVT